MSSKLHISDDLSIPAEALAQTQAILAIKGAGKTYAAMKMMEEAVKAGFQSVAADPTGVWWGISADGDGKGLPVLVMGGEHGNVPLESTSGEVVAEYIVDSGRSVVLDLSLMRKAEMHRFMAAFLDKLYHYKATHRESLHVFFDEADTAAPQQPGPEQTKVLGAAEDVVRRGRSRGLGMTLITQRPAVLNKNLLEMCDTLYVMRVIGSNDQDAIRKRIRVDADDATVDKMMGSLASLSNGEAWAWSPAALGVFKRIKFAKRQTFDSSRSPKPGERVAQPKSRASIDLAELTARIKATVERTKENDPRALRTKIAELERKLAAKPTAETKIIEKPVVTDAQVKRVEGVASRIEAEGKKRTETAEKLAAQAKDLAESGRDLIQQAREFAAALAKAAGNVPAAMQRPAAPRPAAPAMMKPPPVRRQPAHEPSDGISQRQQRFLDAAASLTTLGADVTRETVAAWVGVHPRGGSVGEELKALEDAGFITNDRGRIAVTAEGMAAAGSIDPGQAIERAKSGLSPRQQGFFELIVAAHPGSTTREAIAEHFGIHPRGGSLGEDLGRLVGRGLVEGRRGEYRARDFLFAGV